MNKKTEKLFSDYKERIIKTFKDENKLIVVYGSIVDGNVSSDLDVCVFFHNYNNDDAKKLAEITIQFHKDNNMKLDDEVPFNIKTIYSYFDIERLLISPPFPVYRNRFIVNRIEKNKEFLTSDEVKLRLLLFVLTSNSIVINGDKSVFDSYRKSAWELLIRILFSYLGNKYLSVKEFVDNISVNPINGDEGKGFLGYRKEVLTQRTYLLKETKKYFQNLVDSNKMEFKSGKYRCSKGWIEELINLTLSNNIYSSKFIKLIEYPKMNGYDFSENANPFGPPKSLLDASKVISKFINVYSDYKNIVINGDLSEFLNVPMDNVAVCNGSLEAIYAIPRFLNSTKATVIVPTYWGYAAGLDILERKYEKIVLKTPFNYKLEELHDAAKKSTMLFICNPNNPTSSYLDKKDIYKLIQDNPQCHFIIDESHILLHKDFFKETMSSEIRKLSNFSIVYSLSKFFSVAGLRVGAIVSNETVISKFKKWQVPYSLNTIAQAIFPLCLKDKDFIRKTRENIPALVRDLSNELSKFDWLEVKPSKTNFIMCKIKGKITAQELSDKLEKDGIYIRELTSSYPEVNGEYIRISVNTKELNDLLIKKIKSYNI